MVWRTTLPDRSARPSLRSSPPPPPPLTARDAPGAPRPWNQRPLEKQSIRESEDGRFVLKRGSSQNYGVKASNKHEPFRWAALHVEYGVETCNGGVRDNYFLRQKDKEFCTEYNAVVGLVSHLFLHESSQVFFCRKLDHTEKSVQTQD